MPGPIGRQTVTVLDAPLITGDYNSKVRDWANASATPVTGCTVDYTGSTESRQAKDQTVTTAELALPRRAPRVTEWQRVQWDGRTWEVDGVTESTQGAGRLSGQTVRLLEVAG
ncbi:head-tail adaptor protein [Streptomyces sp. NPDC005953]|uniref:head-tail adaptor protein n=1 Tax=Streptomyces sp. NPDC005953 TaxID=3156719 RepID=UPI0033F32E0F